MLKLRGDRLAALVAERFGSVDSLFLHWHETAKDARTRADKPPDRSTIYRWIDGTLPRYQEQLWRLAALLDVDPFCLFEFPDMDDSAARQALYRAFWLDSWPPALAFLPEFFGHHHAWPPPHFATQYFRRGWHAGEFTHTAQARINFYAPVEIRTAHAAAAARIVHFAYRQAGLFAERWIQYGFVERTGTAVRLISVNGQTDSCELGARDPMLVGTWFGPGPCAFKVASLHPIEVAVRDPETGAGPHVHFLA